MLFLLLRAPPAANRSVTRGNTAVPTNGSEGASVELGLGNRLARRGEADERHLKSKCGTFVGAAAVRYFHLNYEA